MSARAVISKMAENAPKYCEISSFFLLPLGILLRCLYEIQSRFPGTYAYNGVLGFLSSQAVPPPQYPVKFEEIIARRIFLILRSNFRSSLLIPRRESRVLTLERARVLAYYNIRALAGGSLVKFLYYLTHWDDFRQNSKKHIFSLF